MFKKNNMDLIPILRGSVNLKVSFVNKRLTHFVHLNKKHEWKKIWK